ncbi:hypothetical protein O6H91_05G106400 [Diphasiastrum complanatum]|nr:hypothetical protein O6H91_05G106400 [Diphasiastrum complanatum]
MGRNVEAASKVKEDILHSIPQARVEVLEGDLSSLASVKQCANDFLALKSPLNILINNAGVMASPYQLSKDGIEMQFATNHVGPFLLTYLLMDKMKETARESGIEGRIINVSSVGHTFLAPKGGIAFDTINNEAKYNPWKAYGQSKLANVLHASELSRQLKEQGVNITTNSVHPGAINTNLLRHIPMYKGAKAILNHLGMFIGFRTVTQGASTQCFVALNPKAKGVTGKYFSDCKEVKPSKYARDPDLAKKLWDFSIGLTSQYLI